MTDHEATEPVIENTPPVGDELAGEELVPLALLQETEQKRDEYLDHYRRMAAEFDNYKKRQARLAEQQTQQAGERILKGLLPVLDDLERAVEAVAKEDVADGTRNGLTLVRNSLRDVVEREGMTAIDPVSLPFNPHEHEALLTQPTADAPEGSVLQVVQRGWKLGDRVVRPARVVVAAALHTESTEPE